MILPTVALTTSRIRRDRPRPLCGRARIVVPHGQIVSWFYLNHLKVFCICAPALQQLLAEIRANRVDVVVVYKIDRLTRSLADFAKIVDIFDAKGVSFVSVSQQFNTTTSMGRLTLNVLLLIGRKRETQAW